MAEIGLITLLTVIPIGNWYPMIVWVTPEQALQKLAQNWMKQTYPMQEFARLSRQWPGHRQKAKIPVKTIEKKEHADPNLPVGYEDIMQYLKKYMEN